MVTIGGISRTVNASVERLDDLDGPWKQVKSMNTPRFAFAEVFCKRFVYVIGGYSTEVEKTVERYDPNENVWINVNSMNVERRGHAACVLHDKIYVVGGESSDGIQNFKNRFSFELYLLSTGSLIFITKV